MSEEALNQVSLERLILVAALKTKGIEDTETRGLLVAWTEKREQKVEQAGTREAQVEFEIERAELYKEAGLVDEALVAFEDILTIVTNEGLEELVIKIREKIFSL